LWCSNGLGHQTDETELDEVVAPAHDTPLAATETGEPAPREMFSREEQVLAGRDESCEGSGTVDDMEKPAVDDGGNLAAVEPRESEVQSQQQTPDREPPAETEMLEAEVEGKLSERQRDVYSKYSTDCNF